MGCWSKYRCTKCGLEITTSGYWEFYRDKNGTCKPYGHPSPISAEATKQGCKGFYIEWYCSQCKEIRNVILKEFEQPCFDSPYGQLSMTDRVFNFSCDKCGDVLKEDLKKENCPVCGNNAFELAKWLIS
jgi:hypothetical protein